MRQPSVTDNAVEVQQLAFRSDGAVEITYMEQRDQGDGVGVVRVLIFERTKGEPYIDEIENDIRDLVDAMIDKLRGVPDMIPGSR